MKVFAIWDDDWENKTPIGYLFCYEKENAFMIELNSELDEWNAPLLFSSFVKKNIYTIPREISALWVRERVIPSGRQNIGSILKNHKMTEYNEMKLLALSKGKCSQDSCYLKEITYNGVPQEIRARSLDNVTECFVSGEHDIICLFQNDMVRRVDLRKLAVENEKIASILRNKKILNTVEVGVGGYSITFNQSIAIDKRVLIEKGTEIKISAQDFYSFVNQNIVDTAEACEILQCSKQNLTYLMKTGKVKPIRQGLRENLFYKGNIEENTGG